jgi:hypothetical protein
VSGFCLSICLAVTKVSVQVAIYNIWATYLLDSIFAEVLRLKVMALRASKQDNNVVIKTGLPRPDYICVLHCGGNGTY